MNTQQRVYVGTLGNNRVTHLVDLYKQVYGETLQPGVAVKNAVELLICRLENELEEGTQNANSN